LTSPDSMPPRRIGRSTRSPRHTVDWGARQGETPYLDAYRDLGYTSFTTPVHKRGKGAPAKLVDVLGPAVFSVDAVKAGGVDDMLVAPPMSSAA